MGTTSTDSSPGQSRHSELIERSEQHGEDYAIERRRNNLGREQKVKYLRGKYREIFDLDQDDLQFITGLAVLEVTGVAHIKNEQGEPLTREHSIAEGHRWLIDYYDPDLDELREANLIQSPHIDSEPRERIINRRFLDLTASGRDIVDRDYRGTGVGDLGEHVVHRLGVHLFNWWAEEKWDAGGVETERYPTVNGCELDAVVRTNTKFVTKGRTDSLQKRHAVEVETGLSDTNSLEGDAQKLAHTEGDSIWVFPTRSVLAECLEDLALRGYCGLDYPVPATLPTRNHRDTYQKRIDATTRELDELEYPAISRVFTYRNIVDDLKEWRPELFYGNPEQR